MICFEVDANLNGIVLWRVKFNYDVYHNGQVSEQRLLFTSFTLSAKRYFTNINCKWISNDFLERNIVYDTTVI